jgi:hypothetical protein
MDVLIMEPLKFTRYVGEIGIEDRIAFCFPPKPVLNDCVERMLLFTIAMCDDARTSSCETYRSFDWKNPYDHFGNIGVCPVRFRYSWMS